jgi:hypothetical protein
MLVRFNRLAELPSPTFIVSLALLVFNDFVLKPAFHNSLTGKLSDFAGLFALTLLVGTLWPNYRRMAGWTIAAAFTFWKTSYAESLIEAWNAVAPFAVGRTVDLTDLVALPMIALAVWAAPRLEPWTVPRGLQIGLAILAPLAFTATSSPHYLVRSTLDVSSVSNVDESTLEGFFDQVAEEHGLSCGPCDPLADGRIYYQDRTRRKSPDALTVNLDAEQGRLFYETWETGGRQGQELVLALSADIRLGMQERFPSVTTIEFEDDPEAQSRNSTVFTIQVATESALSVETVEQAKRTLSAIVEEVVRTHGLRIGEDAPLYYAGGRYGTSVYNRDLILQPSSASNTKLQVRVTRQTDNYAELHEAINDDLAERLAAAFGPAAVNREDYPPD